MTSSSAGRRTRPEIAEEPLLDSCDFPPDRLASLRELAVAEDWGADGAVMLRHLALHIPLAIEQGRYVWSGKHLVLRAGQLATSEGAPIYVGLGRAQADRWSLDWASDRPEGIEPLPVADLGHWPALRPGCDVALAQQHDLRGTPLEGLPPVTQMAAVAGAVTWSTWRGLAVQVRRREDRGYFVPVHFTARDGAPDFAAVIQVQAERVVVRALIAPRAAYPPARAVVARAEDLPAWLRDAWGSREQVTD
jgi:hypothetical protein